MSPARAAGLARAKAAPPAFAGPLNLPQNSASSSSLVPLKGFHNVGFRLEAKHRAVFRPGTSFGGCTFEDGLGRSDDGSADKHAALALIDCEVYGDSHLGTGSHILDSTVHGSLSLDNARAERCTIEGSAEVHFGAELVDCEAKHVGVDTGATASFTKPVGVGSGPQVHINTGLWGQTPAKIHLAAGGVIHASPEDVEVTGALDFVVLVEPPSKVAEDSAVWRSNENIARARYATAVATDRSDPLWLSTQNTDAWQMIFDGGYVDATDSDPQPVPEEVRSWVLALYPNP